MSFMLMSVQTIQCFKEVNVGGLSRKYQHVGLREMLKALQQLATKREWDDVCSTTSCPELDSLIQKVMDVNCKCEANEAKEKGRQREVTKEGHSKSKHWKAMLSQPWRPSFLLASHVAVMEDLEKRGTLQA